MSQTIMTFLTLVRNGATYTVSERIQARSTPSEEICSAGSDIVGVMHQYCCDTLALDTSNQFTLPAPNFAFGIVSDSHVIRYNPALPVNAQLLVDHYRFNTDANMFTFNSNNLRSDITLRTLQLFISKW